MMKNRLIEKIIYNNLPEDLKSLTQNFEDRERDVVLLSSLGVLSNCLPNIKGNYDGDSVYPNLYILIIAPPASGKGVMNYSRVLIDKIHTKIYKDSKAEKHNCEVSKKKNSKERNIENTNDKCPDIQVKIVPANISTSELYTFLGSSKHGLLIMESEADTLSNMLKNDWSNYSDVLRKCFHHEPISIARKIEGLYEEVAEPKLSMVISGTPGQLKPFLMSRENGLFSRFIFYTFDELSNFKDVFAEKTLGNKLYFQEVSERVFNLYSRLNELSSEIEFKYSDRQKKILLARMNLVWEDVIYNHTEAFLPNLKRHSLIMFRIAMVLTTMRNIDSLEKRNELICSNKDFFIALKLTQTILRHSQVVFNSMDSGYLSIQDEELLDSLPAIFERKLAIEKGEILNIPKRTIDDKLSKWQVKKIVKKVSQGYYKKL